MLQLNANSPSYSMLSAKRKSDGQIVAAYFESVRHGPFLCPDCNKEVILKAGGDKVNHFAHANSAVCRLYTFESDAHRLCKLQVFEGLRRAPGVSDVALERSVGTVRPDVSATINGARVAIEVQISSLSIDAIMRRTIEYAQRGIYVLWLLQWTPKLDVDRYTPEQWEKWVHAAYFGRVYYWIEGLTVVRYRFESSFRTIPRTSWYDVRGRKITTGGYSLKSKRYRTTVRGEVLNLVRDFVPRQRDWWEGGGITVPDARIFIERDKRKGMGST
jgi:competence protein CoiA